MFIAQFMCPLIHWWTLGRFRLLAIGNSAAVNVCVPVFVWVPILHSLGYISRSGTAGSYGNSMFSFWEQTNCFPQQLNHSTFPLAMGMYLLFSFSFLKICYSHLSGCEVVSHCVFYLHFLCNELESKVQTRWDIQSLW